MTAGVLIGLLDLHREHNRIVFAVELAGIWAFAAFWFVKSVEICKTREDAIAALALKREKAALDFHKPSAGLEDVDLTYLQNPAVRARMPSAPSASSDAREAKAKPEAVNLA